MRLAIVLLLLLPSVVFGQKKAASPAILFTVKGQAVMTDEFEYVFRKNHVLPTDFTDEKIDEYINLFVEFKLKVAEAKSRGMDTTQAFVKEYNTYKDELKRPYLASADDLLRLTREMYDRLTEEVRASHILILTKPDAVPADTLAAYRKIADLRSRAVAGQDFGKLAVDFSQDPSARQNNGDLGYFTAMQMVYPFESAAYKTKTGEISPIVRTRFGYHIIKIVDRRPARGEVEVSHIILRTDKGDKAKIKNTIFEVYDQLKGGRKWEDVCKEFSEDANTKNSGGRLKPFGIGALSSVPEFEKVAFSLNKPGDVSDPFQSNIGWHIIRLERKIPLPPYNEMEASLKRKVARDERLTIAKNQTLARRKAELNFKLNQVAMDRLSATVDSTLTKGRWKFTGPQAILSDTLFELNHEKTTTRDFVQYLTKQTSLSTAQPAVYLQQLLDRFIEGQINDKDEVELMAKHPDFRMLLNEYKEGILFFEIMEKEVWNKASEDTAGQRRYYNEHRESYKAGNRVEARIYGTNNKEFRDEIRGKISAGDTLSAADLKKFTSISNKRVYKTKDSQVIDQINWSQGVHEAEVNGVFYLVEVTRLVPPGIQTFDEAKGAVISEYQTALEKKWLATLRKKYPVKVNKEGRKVVMAELKHDNIAR